MSPAFCAIFGASVKGAHSRIAVNEWLLFVALTEKVQLILSKKSFKILFSSFYPKKLEKNLYFFIKILLTT